MLEPPLDELSRKVWGMTYDILDSVKSAVIVIFLMFTFLFRIVGVDGHSMNPTLTNGDWLTVSATRVNPRRGDIVVVTQPKFMHEPLIKRVIAVGGDVIDIDVEARTVSVNGQVIPEPYIKEPIQESKLGPKQYPFTVEEGYIFVMGDNRNGSTDSRSDAVGLIDTRYVLGAARHRLFPFGQFTIDA